MLKNQDIICFSSIDWDFIWQGHQEIMSTLADNGNRVLFIENTGARRPALTDLPRLIKRFSNWRKGVGGIRQERKNLYVYSPLVFPFPYSRLARWINSIVMIRNLKRWMSLLNFSEPIAWVFLPTGTVLSVLKKLSVKLLIYYCIDDFSKSSKAAKKIVKTEEELLRKADMVFVTSEQLYQKSLRYNNCVFSFSFGVNVDHFNLSKITSLEKPPEIEKLETPLIGYIGGIHRWIDQELIKDVAIKRPNDSFVFIGPIQTEIKELKDQPNVVFLGQKTRGELPRYVRHFAVCLIPYKLTPYTENVYPTKLNEYLAIGKPVISTPLPEILNFNRLNQNIVEVASSPEEFSDKLDKILKDPEEETKARFRIETALRNSWTLKIERMSQHVEEALSQKLEQQQAHWRESLLIHYQRARRNTLKLAVVIGGLYLLIFHSPLVWWIAQPLRLTSRVDKSDLIAVLGGGVGESGLAGEGYQERVKEGVDLLMKGYGARLLFSSGYQYSFKEVDVMKALAVDLGVPKEKILLEKRPAGTYDHLVCLKEILQKNGFHSVIIVSSPYHMRRAWAVSKKILSGYKISLNPVEKSVFFGNRPPVKLRHIRAILHEYLALLYYAFKGYI